MKIETIDMHIDIIDNYGDMGWVLEFLIMSGLPCSFRIITDDRAKLVDFFGKSGTVLPDHEIVSVEEFSVPNPLSIFGLHAKRDLEIFPDGCHIIRVNYLSYEPWYVARHETEHILSRRDRQIIEVSYSPLWGSGGVWHYETSETTRRAWLEKHGLDPALESKKWIPIFVYPETLKYFDYSEIPDDVCLFFIGTSPASVSAISAISDPSASSRSYHFPWLARDDFWSLIDLAHVSILRGEISSLRGLMSGRPLLWDMYKEMGGWNGDDSKAFLEWMHANREYRNMHNIINSGKKWDIFDIIKTLENYTPPNSAHIPDFQKTIEKTIDKLGFSL